MYTGKLVFSQVIEHLPMHTFRRCCGGERGQIYFLPERELMREALHRGQLIGHPRFVDEVEQIIGCRVERRRLGGPSSRRA